MAGQHLYLRLLMALVVAEALQQLEQMEVAVTVEMVAMELHQRFLVPL